mgnify:CR=1 FL=1
MQDSTAEYNRGNDCCLVVHIKNELIGSLEPDVAASVKTLSGRCFVVGFDESNTRIWRQEPGPEGCHNVKELFLFCGEPHGENGWYFHETFGITKGDDKNRMQLLVDGEALRGAQGSADNSTHRRDERPDEIAQWRNCRTTCAPAGCSSAPRTSVCGSCYRSCSRRIFLSPLSSRGSSSIARSTTGFWTVVRR